MGSGGNQLREDRNGGELLPHPLSSHGQLQTLSLDDDDDLNDVSTSKSFSNYRSAVATLNSSQGAADTSRFPPPLSFPTTPAVSDPLLFPSASPPLDSPSYAEVIAGPFHDPMPESNGEIDADSSSDFRPQDSEYLRVGVSNPQKEADSSGSLVPGSGSFISYLITTTTNISDYGASDFAVRRRFRDIVTLSDRLSESYRGFFIPPRPDKSVVESQVMQKQDFVEQRRAELEKYLRRLSRHPVLRKSDELRLFLTAQGKMPLPTTTDVASRMLDGAARLPRQLLGESPSVIEPQDVAHSAKSGRDMLRYLKELKQSVVNDWSNWKPPIEEDDKEFLENKRKLTELEQQLTNVSKQAESVVKSQQDVGETFGELGLAFIKLTKFENEQGTLSCQRVRASDMKCLATAAVKASRFYRDLNSKTVKHFDVLHEYMGLILAVHNAFSDRSNALLTVQTLISELSSLHSRVEKLENSSSKIFGGDKSRIRRLEDLRDAIRVTEGAKSCAIKEYERIKENNRSEIRRLDEELRDDSLNMLKGFAASQVTYLEKIGAEWSRVADETSKYGKP
ncbi:hypothetical protein M569_03417 [Genlisea aurea]|uniref:PX domain-containing protein n=1 Tax=Genlisea aurea TaxID=192259 RepID=S8CWW2_9LAMI|nr:hypothetical protein M569_03417 [Genlisea aurea]